MPLKSIDIVDPLRQGLRRLGRPIRNNFQLVQCDNVAVYPDGITPFDEVQDPFNAQVSTSWPFPQMFKGKDGNMWLLDQTTINKVTTSTNPWTTAAQTTYDFATPASTKAIVGTGTSIWHYADMGRSQMWFNGVETIIYFPDYNAKYLVDDTVGVKTGCYHRGRVVMGDLNSFFTSTWQTYLTDLAEENLDDEYTMTNYGNQVWFSEPGGGDVLWPFSLALAKQGRVDDGFHNDTADSSIHKNFPMMMENWKRNGGGIITMEWAGDVLCTLPLGKFCMVYGDKGISALYPAQGTYGMETVMHTGIAGRGAVAGDDQQHVFPDEDGYLWTIDAQLKTQKLDYHEFFDSTFIANNPVITYDPTDGEFFIARLAEGYLLTRSGLSRVYQSPTAIIHQPTTGLSATKPYGVFADNNLGQDALIKTDLFDFGATGMKTIKAIELGSRIGDNGASVTMSYRTDMDDNMNSGTETNVDDTGRATLNVSGIEFQMEVKLKAV